MRLTLRGDALAPDPSWRPLEVKFTRVFRREGKTTGLTEKASGVRIDAAGGALLPIAVRRPRKIVARFVRGSTSTFEWPALSLLVGDALIEAGRMFKRDRHHRIAVLEGDRPSKGRRDVHELPVPYVEIIDRPHTLTATFDGGAIRVSVEAAGKRWALELKHAPAGDSLGVAASGRAGWVRLEELVVEAGAIEAADPR